MRARRRAREIVAWALAAACPLGCAEPSAFAADEPRAGSLAASLGGSARAAYDAAGRLFQHGDYAGAAARYREAYELAHDPRLLYDVAICEKNRGAYARMRRLLERYMREAGASLTGEPRAMVDDALAASRALVGTVRVTTDAADATVSVDGEAPSPAGEPVEVDPGRHTVVVARPGFETETRAVDVAAGVEVPLAVMLRPEMPVGRLIVTAPPGSSLWIDGEIAGTDRFDGAKPAGEHLVRVRAPDGGVSETRVALHEHETRSVDLGAGASRHGPLVWPWVAGGVAVAAGVAVGAYFLFKPESHTAPVPPGDFAVRFDIGRSR